MASGNKNESKANADKEAGIAALKPKSYVDPYGTFKKGRFTPNLTPEQEQTQSVTQDKLLGMVNNIPTELDANSLFENPFYSTLSDSYKRSIDSRKQQDTLELDNQLNARNQTGSSYDAYRRSLLDKDYNSQYLQGEAQARTGAADTYLNAYQNSLAGLQTLRGDQSAALDQIYMPAKIALGYQSSVAPLQQGQANLYGQSMNSYLNKPGMLDQLLNYWSGNAQMAGKIASAGAI